MIVFGAHLEAHRPSESCVVYIKQGIVGARALGKCKCHSDADNQGYITGSR